MRNFITDQDKVAATMEKWAEYFQADCPVQIVALYAKDAVLWGTVSPTRRDSPESISEYFTQTFSL